MPASLLVGDRTKVDSSSLLGLNDDLSLYAALRIMPRGVRDAGIPSVRAPRSILGDAA
jgi:hypothetical protein